MLFLDEPYRALYRDWPAEAVLAVASLRQVAARHPDDQRLADLVGQLTIHSDLRAGAPRADAGRSEGIPSHSPICGAVITVPSAPQPKILVGLHTFTNTSATLPPPQ
ncbi:hypothetical protein [Streptomyces sp. NPDC085596]|uniref:MmyB family transcriptional regulator n=1 Tax=Streptomyces sp. NPDC085596 TaxID=3365731 RepID=UPI0037D3B143